MNNYGWHVIWRSTQGQQLHEERKVPVSVVWGIAVGAGYFGSRLGTVDKVKGNVDCTECYY